MFGDKYRRNYNRVHRASYGIPTTALSVVAPTTAYYPNTYANTGVYPYTAGVGGYGMYGGNYGYPQMAMGAGMPMGSGYDRMIGGYDSDFGYDYPRRMRGRRRYPRRYHDYDDFDYDY